MVWIQDRVELLAQYDLHSQCPPPASPRPRGLAQDRVELPAQDDLHSRCPPPASPRPRVELLAQDRVELLLPSATSGTAVASASPPERPAGASQDRQQNACYLRITCVVMLGSKCLVGGLASESPEMSKNDRGVEVHPQQIIVAFWQMKCNATLQHGAQ